MPLRAFTRAPPRRGRRSGPILISPRCAAGAPEIWQALTRSLVVVRALACTWHTGSRSRLRRRAPWVACSWVRDPICTSPASTRRRFRRRRIRSWPCCHIPRWKPCRSPSGVSARWSVSWVTNTARLMLAAREIARVLAPGAKLSFLVHHADSAIVAATRARLDVIDMFLGPDAARGLLLRGRCRRSIRRWRR